MWFAFPDGIGLFSQRGSLPEAETSAPSGISGSATTGSRKAIQQKTRVKRTNQSSSRFLL
jgi:hypothetical protein